MYTSWILSSAIFAIFSFTLYQALPDHAYIHHQDSQGYKALADMIQTTGMSGFDTLPPVGVGYPFILSCITRVTHYVPGSFHGWLVFFQVCIIILTFFFLYRLVREVLGDQYDFLVAFFCVTHVGFLTYTQVCLSEVWLSCLYTIFLYLAVCSLKESKEFIAAQAGAVLGLSLWIKPAAWIYGWHLAFIALLVCLFTRSSYIKSLGTFTAGFCLVGGFNLLFNYWCFGVIGFPPLMYTNLYYFLLPKMLAITRGWTFENAVIVAHQWPQEECLYQLVQVIYEYPGQALSIWLQNMLKTFLGLFGANLALLARGVEQASTSFFELPGSCLERIISYCYNEHVGWGWNAITWMEAILMGMRLILFIPGWYVLYRRTSIATFYLLFSFVGYFIFITGADGCARLRMMSEPVFILIMVAGFIFFLRGTQFQY